MRMTITLSDERHRAVKASAAARGRTITELIDESLEFYGVRSESAAQDLVARTRGRLAEADAVDLAVAETRAERNEHDG